MLDYFKEKKLSKFSILTIPIMLFGIIWGSTDLLPLSFLGLIICASLSIIIQFDFDALKRLFKKMKKKSWHWILFLVPISLFSALKALQFTYSMGFTTSPNQGFGTGSTGELLFRFLTICISLIGEELIVAAVALPIFNILSKKLGKNSSWIITLIASSVLFGLMHYNAYNGNLYQMIFIVGLTRIPLTILWDLTDSIRGGIYGHILYDAIIFIPILIDSL